MENGLFRQKSLEQIVSPEETRDYLRVTSPRLWMILGALAVLIAGFIIYASTARLENTTTIRAEVTNYTAADTDGVEKTISLVYASIPKSELQLVETGMTVRLEGETGKISWVSITGEDNATLMVTMDKEDLVLAEGEHKAELVLEQMDPFSFLSN